MTVRILVIAAIIGTVVFFINTQESTITTRPAATSTPVVSVEPSSDVENARKQLEEATGKLNAEEAKILAETEAASSTAHAQVATIMAEYEAVKAENDRKLDEINEVRSSF
jgi:hypothetical protein